MVAEPLSLLLDAGTTDVDEVIGELDHEPNGYFWEGIAAHGPDRATLDELSSLMTAVATNADRLRQLVALAETRGFEFDT